jgi:hypothetical protein
MNNTSSEATALASRPPTGTTEPRGPTNADVVAGMAHLVGLADRYLHGASAGSDRNAHELVQVLVAQSLRHLNEIRWEWVEFHVARAIRLAADRHPKPKPKPTKAALLEWRASTAQNLQRALYGVDPKSLSADDAECRNAQAGKEPTLEAHVERALTNFDQLRTTRRKAGVWENLTVAASNIFGTRKVTAQREMQLDKVPVAIGADISLKPCLVPEWLTEELDGGGLRAGLGVKARRSGEAYKAKARQATLGYSPLLLDALLTGEFRAPTRLASKK